MNIELQTLNAELRTWGENARLAIGAFFDVENLPEVDILYAGRNLTFHVMMADAGLFFVNYWLLEVTNDL